MPTNTKSRRHTKKIHSARRIPSELLNESGYVGPSKVRLPAKQTKRTRGGGSAEPLDIVFGPLVILGYQDGILLQSSEATASDPAVMAMTIAAPPGTIHAFAALQGVFLAYGDWGQDKQGALEVTSLHDHHVFALETTAAASVDASASPPTVTITTRSLLTDISLKEHWVGQAKVSVLFLGGSAKRKPV